MYQWQFVAGLIIFLEISSCGQFCFSSALPSTQDFFYSSATNQLELDLTHSRGTRDVPIQSNSANKSSNVGGGSALPVGADKLKKTEDDVPTGVMTIPVKPFDANYTKHTPRPEDSFENFGEDGKSDGYPGQPKFDENAVQRALIVVAFLAFVVLVYLGAKFMLTKKKKTVDKRYGRIESEIDLLDEMEEAETDEEEELFDVNATRRSNF